MLWGTKLSFLQLMSAFGSSLYFIVKSRQNLPKPDELYTLILSFYTITRVFKLDFFG